MAVKIHIVVCVIITLHFGKWLPKLCKKLLSLSGHAVVRLVEALRYKPEGRDLDSRWCHWNSLK